MTLRAIVSPVFSMLLLVHNTIPFNVNSVNRENVHIYGPGLQPHLIVMPVRYFFIKILNENVNYNFIPSDVFTVKISGNRVDNKYPCRIWTKFDNLYDGTLIVRYKLFETCVNFKIVVALKRDNSNLHESPFHFQNHLIQPNKCNCPQQTITDWLTNNNCSIPNQITNDLSPFKSINFNVIRPKIIARYNQPNAVSICNYVIKSNKIHRKCYGKHVGFNMFMDAILLSLTRTLVLPDVEFFVNLGDWPLEKNTRSEIYPIFSWCGSDDTKDIVMPTYDLTQSSLEMMGKVSLDVISVMHQANAINWTDKSLKMFWRGRDSNKLRFTLLDLGKEHPDLFDVAITAFFFSDERDYGPKAPYVSFFDFFKYKYLINVDGTVAAYRLPYLLAGNSIVFKHKSKYYEHFYNDLKPYHHYIPVDEHLSDLVSLLSNAIQNETVNLIWKNAQTFVRDNLLPQNIFCYHVTLLDQWRHRVDGDVNVIDGMAEVHDEYSQDGCVCSSPRSGKEEL